MNMNINLPLEDLAKRYSQYYVYIEPVVSDPLVRGYFNLVASFLLIAFFLVFALSPTIDTILTLRKKIDEQNQAIKTMDQKIANLVIAQANYSQVESSLPVLFTALPQTPTPQTIISEVMAAASSSGLVVQGLQFQELPLSADSVEAQVQAQKTSDALTVKFILNATDSPDKTRSFLTKIESLPRQIHILDLGITKNPEVGGAVSFSVTAVGYYLPDQVL